MVFLLGQSDPEGPVLGGEGRGVIPLEVACLLVAEANGFPAGIVAG